MNRRLATAALPWAAYGAGSALVVGAATATSIRLGVVAAIALALAVTLVNQPGVILVVLAISVFAEVVSLGGLTISRLFAPLALLVVLAETARGRARIAPAAPLGWVAAYVLWAFASGLWTISLGGTKFLLSSLVLALAYMIAFAALLSTRRELERVLYTLAAAGLAFGLFATATFVLNPSRKSGAVGDPNFFAAYQVAVLPLVLVLAAEARSRWLRLCLVGTALVVAVSILASISRGGFLALAATTLVLLILPAGAIFTTRAQKAVVLIVVMAGTAIAAQKGTNVLPRLNIAYAELTGASTSQTREARGSGRVNIWLAAKTTIRERPLLGVGYGAFTRVSNDLMRRTPGVDLENFELVPRGSAAHDAFIESTAELGIPGLLLFLGLLISMARLLRRTAARARVAGEWFTMRVANAVLVSLVGWSVASIFISSETSRPLWILIGIGLALPKLLPAKARE
jgi:O-antigen ligase